MSPFQVIVAVILPAALVIAIAAAIRAGLRYRRRRLARAIRDMYQGDVADGYVIYDEAAMLRAHDAPPATTEIPAIRVPPTSRREWTAPPRREIGQ